jgi:signal transduction histidine kinase
MDQPPSDWLLKDAENNNRRLIVTRWLAGALMLLLTVFCVHMLGLPLREYPLYALGDAILIYNVLLVILTRRAERIQHIQRIIMLQVILDWLSLGVFIHLTGGITSPGIALFLIHVVLVTVTLPGRPSYLYVPMATLILVMIASLERIGTLPHYSFVSGSECELCENNVYTVGQVAFFSVTLLATMLLTAKVMTRLRERERQVNALLQTVRDTSSTLKLDRVLENLLRNAAHALSVPGASIRLLDSSGEYLTMAASYGLSQTYLQKGSVAMSQSRLDQTALAGSDILIGEVAGDSRIQYPQEMSEEGIHSLLVVPVTGHKPLGVLRAYSDVSNHFQQKDADFLRAIAYQSAAAIENAVIYESLQQSEQQRTQFIHHITHELRAPVTAAQSLLRVLLHNMAGTITPQQHDMLTRIENRMDALLELIADLLTLAASKSLDQSRELTAVSLQLIMQRVVDDFGQLAEEQGIHLSLTMPTKPLAVRATENGLAHILDNLVSNAIKYTMQGGSVRVELTKRGNCAQLIVTDTGIGIAAESLEHLTEEFYRAPNARSASIPGTGLGMAIVRQYVASFSGLMRIQSTIDVGTTVTVTLPLNPS